jgi:hypothetical protein
MGPSGIECAKKVVVENPFSCTKTLVLMHNPSWREPSCLLSKAAAVKNKVL